MRNNQRFTAVRDLIGSKHRLRRVTVNGTVSIHSYGDRRVREWTGEAITRWTYATTSAATKLLLQADPVVIRGIGEVYITGMRADGIVVVVSLASTGPFKVPPKPKRK